MNLTDQIAERYVPDAMELDPLGATLWGIAGYDDRMSDTSPDGFEAPPGTGWHDGEVWNAELAWEFLRSHSHYSDANLRFALDRCLGAAGQVPAYKLGERVWLQAREDARQRQGASFDLNEFHRQALALGSLGLDPLREALAWL